MKRFFLALTFIFLANIIYATAIFILVTPSGIYLGIDSRTRITGMSPSGKQTVIFDSTTKIYKSRQFYFTVFGFYGDPSGKYKPHVTVSEELYTQSNIDSAVSNIRKKLEKGYFELFTWMKKNDTARFNQEKQRIPESIITILCIVNNKPRLYTVNIKINLTSFKTSFKIDKFESNSKDYYITIGGTGKIERHLSKNKLDTANPTTFIEKMIMLEAKASPDWIAKPIDIIKADNKSVYWIQRPNGKPIEIIR